LGGRGFDLNEPAFCELCGDEGGYAAGGCNINWKVVDVSQCNNFRAGKSKPNCNLCPSGSTCNNPDPNRNGGVDWNSYCPGVIPLGSGINRRRCEMRIDGCTCYGGSGGPNPTPVSPNPTPVAPPTTGSSGGKGKTNTRCGSDWGAANSACGTDCLIDEVCPNGHKCFRDLGMSPCGVTSALISDESSTTENNDYKGIIAISVGVGLLLLAVVLIAIIMVKRRRMEEIV